MPKEKSFQQPGTQQSHFATVPRAQIERSTFDRSHGHKTTMDAGQIVPVYWDEVLPGDTFEMHSTMFARLATPLKPVMDNMYMDVHYFFVPYRLLWDKWQRFMGEQETPNQDNSGLTIPQQLVAIDNNGSTTFHNYMGVPYRPDLVGAQASVCAFPRRAYDLIFNEWFRDQNLVPPAPQYTDDGPDPVRPLDLCLPRAKRHDYFTSCLPWPQKGDQIFIPIGTTAPVVGTGTNPEVRWSGDLGTGTNVVAQVTGAGDDVLGIQGVGPGTPTQIWWEITGMEADLTTAAAVSINELRTAFQVQRLLERDARGGTRYIEILLSHFNVSSPDGRLQRPEILGVATTTVNINPVAATFNSTEVPQGVLAAYGTAIQNGGFTKSFTEHGIILGLASVRADLSYQQGLERMWSRKTRYDYYWPALSHLGEQAVLNKEIFWNNNPAQDDAVFGYQERYAEYRYKQSQITGRFKSDDEASLDVWHLAEDYAALPTLSDTFIYATPPVDRVIAVPAEPHFLVDMWFKLKTTRVMPVYAVPGMIDHF